MVNKTPARVHFVIYTRFKTWEGVEKINKGWACGREPPIWASNRASEKLDHVTCKACLRTGHRTSGRR